MDLHHVQRYLRHADPKTPLRYARMGTTALHAATSLKFVAEASFGGSPSRMRCEFLFEPPKGFEPSTYGLRNRCSTPELGWQESAASITAR